MPMIRSGRCDECRRRKRKCDEAKPDCAGCVERDVQCVYTHEQSRFVHLHAPQPVEALCGEEGLQARPDQRGTCQIVLNIRSSKEPPSGKGLYHTFVPRKPGSKERRPKKSSFKTAKSITPPLTSDTSHLQCAFADILHGSTAAGHRMRTWGPFLETALPRIGTSILLDRAVICLVSGHKARFSSDPKAGGTSRYQYGEALMLLRDAVSENDVAVTSEMIAATQMLMIYEIMMASEMQMWLSHAFGTINLFLAAGPVACQDELGGILFSSTYAQGWQQSILTGCPSPFDRPDWLDLVPETRHRRLSKGHSKRQFQLFTRLPRLTAVVRKLRQDLSNEEVAADAVALAEELLDLCWVERDESATNAQIVATAQEEDAELVPFSFQYAEDDFQLVLGIIYTLSCKIMLCGLLQIMQACGAPIQHPTLSEVYEEERRCAMLICMTVDYGASLAPYGCINFLFPLQVAWGTYWRQKDFGLEVDCEGLMDWLVRRGNVFLSFCTPGVMSESGMAFFTERLMGGSLLSNEAILGDAGLKEEAELEDLMLPIREHMDLVDTTVATERSEISFEEALRSLSDSREVCF